MSAALVSRVLFSVCKQVKKLIVAMELVILGKLVECMVLIGESCTKASKAADSCFFFLQVQLYRHYVCCKITWEKHCDQKLEFFPIFLIKIVAIEK